MRIINTEIITQTVAELCVSANIHLGQDVRRALETASNLETSKLGKSALGTILKNADIAAKENLPICQDTGMAVVFVQIGSAVHVEGNIEEAINEGVRRGYKAGYCRNSIVADPIRRQNTGDNTPAVIHYEFAPGDEMRITVAPKGFGSENMSAVRMLNPSDGIDGVEDFVVETVAAAGSNPCPPIIVGVGIGGTMEKAALLAKKALLREMCPPNPAPDGSGDAFWRESEARLLARINDLNIGPCGYGGHTTALAVHILTFPTHIAGLPVAVNINCHVARHKEAAL